MDGYSMDWETQTKNFVLSLIINLFFFSIWFCKNTIHFEDANMNLHQVIHNIIVNAYLSGTNSKGCTRSYMCDFRVLKEFNIAYNSPNASALKEVICEPPLLSR